MKKSIRNAALIAGTLTVSSFLLAKAINRKRFSRLSIGHQKEEAIPTVILHGVNGNKRTMQGMLQRMHKQNVAYKALEIEVAEDGEVFVNGTWGQTQGYLKPVIQVFFDNNDAPAELQAEWLKSVMVFLHDKLEVQKVNLIGHSMGGVTSLHYLTQIKTFQESVPRVSKLITLGSPFKGNVAHTIMSQVYKLEKSEEGIRNFDDNFTYFMVERNKLPEDLRVLNIYGDVENGTESDSIVKVESALALGEIVKDNVASYNEIKLTGIRSQHTLLHENPEADEAIIKFLWYRDLDSFD
ncbi:alpha/beta fold hydrolase [Vagococcus sp. BWB3-3]|uniref:Alpha/beta fold hydrolase n=1 Tax=Vagococcus allomyrinae TaxID=2794353 RepID=A0A940P5K2_9ENTE|nr:alpha/beta fold hydrolase [Vagococcus allomyrinae]MBP1040171.1 alpha/beta fold hydrolase [Vagococcus allomyrinae]